MKVMTVGERDFVIGDVVEFVVHVARRIDMDAGGDERDQHEHQHGQGINVVADRKPQAAAVVQGVPLSGIGGRQVRLGMDVAGAGLMVPFRWMLTRGCPAGRWLSLGMASGSRLGRVAAVGDCPDRMASQPDHEGRQGQNQRGHNRCSRHPGRVAAVRAHPRTEEQDRHKGRQWHQPGEPEQERQLCGEVHQRKAQPLRSSARSTSTVAWLL